MIDLIPHHERLSLTANLSISFWLKLDSWPQQWTHLVAKYQDQQRHEFSLRIKNDDQGRWSFGDGTDAFNALMWSPKKHIELGKWVYLCCVKSLGDALVLYVNGNEAARTSAKTDFTAAMTQQPICVGGLLDVDASSACECRIKKLEFRDDALTRFQVRQLFEQTLRQG